MLKQWLKQDRTALQMLLLASLALPCLFCWMLGNLYVEHIPFGVVDLDHSSFSRQIIRGLEDHPGLEVYFVEDQSSLEQQIYGKELNGGMIIPENFYKELQAKHPEELLTVIDGTNTLIANNIMAYVSAVTGTYSAGVMLSILEANGMPADAAMHTYNTFQYGERTLYDPYMSYLSYLIYFIMPYLVQMTVVCIFALPMFSALHQELVQQGIRALSGKKWLELAVRWGYIYVVSALASWIGFCLADYFFGLPVRGTMGCYFLLLGAFEIALGAAAMLLATFIRPKHCLYFFELLLCLGMVLLITNGAIWLPYLMPEGLFKLVGFLWPFAHVALPFKYLNMKGAGLDILTPAIVDCLQYAAFWAVVAIAITSLQRQWHLWRKNKQAQIEDGA